MMESMCFICGSDMARWSEKVQSNFMYSSLEYRFAEEMSTSTASPGMGLIQRSTLGAGSERALAQGSAGPIARGRSRHRGGDRDQTCYRGE